MTSAERAALAREVDEALAAELRDALLEDWDERIIQVRKARLTFRQLLGEWPDGMRLLEAGGEK